MLKRFAISLLALWLAACQSGTETETATLPPTAIQPPPTSTSTPTLRPTFTFTPTLTPTPTFTSTPTATATFTPTPTATPVSGSFVVNCNNSEQLCLPIFSATIVADAPSLLQVSYIAASTHCASVRIHFSLNGVAVYTSGFLGWPGAPAPFDTLPRGTGPINLSKVPAGKHVLDLQAEGQSSGCNAGAPASWGGSYSLKLLPITPTPTP